MSLISFLASGLPAPQKFVLQPGRDTVLIGNRGTQLYVPADAWSTPAGSGPIQLELREFYSLADIVLAGLSTTADGQILETGGMLNLTASTQAGQPVSLRPGASVQLKMPTQKMQADMQLFIGQRHGQSLNWQLDTAVTRAFNISSESFGSTRRKRWWRRPTLHKSLRDEWPQYLSGAREQRRELVRSVTYPVATITKLRRGARRTAQERRALITYNDYVVKTNGRQEKIRRVAEVEFMVDTAGATTNVKLRKGYDAELAAPVLATVSNWQQWKPARLLRLRGLPTQEYEKLKGKEAVIGVVRVMITVSGKILVNPPVWDYQATNELRRTRDATDAANAYRNRVRLAAVRYDSTLRVGGVPAAASQQAPTVNLLYNELNSAGLGWINCDRFVNSAQPLFVYEVDPAAADAQLMLVLRGTRSILAGNLLASTKKVNFGRVPKGAEATVLAIRWQQGQAYLATRAVTLSAAVVPAASALNYQPVTMLELQKTLAALD